MGSTSMIVSGISKFKESLPSYNKASGKRKRIISEINIRCLWYDAINGKYSEHEFSQESLILVENIPVFQLLTDDI